MGHDPKIVATVQVRMGSSRLPGKILKDVMGKPVLGRLLERVGRSRLIGQVVVATSVNPKDDVIEQYCAREGISCFRGSEDDVLSRLLGALQAHQAEVAVALFGDCPLVDPVIIDEVVGVFLDKRDSYDFVGNDLKTSYPPGTEVEVYAVSALEDAQRRTADPGVREHGTLFIRRHPELYRLLNLTAPPELCFPELELELDTAEDLQVVRAVFEHFLGQGREDFATREVIDFMLAHPELMKVNHAVPRLWKQYRDD